jgi:hypothetical protein
MSADYYKRLAPLENPDKFLPKGTCYGYLSWKHIHLNAASKINSVKELT